MLIVDGFVNVQSMLNLGTRVIRSLRIDKFNESMWLAVDKYSPNLLLILKWEKYYSSWVWAN